MPSEPSGAPEPLARLAEVLTRAADGTRPTPLELAELLWLAGHMEPAGDPAAPAAPEPPAPDPQPAETADPPLPPRPHHLDPAAAPPSPSHRVPLHLPGPGPVTKPHATLLAPAPPMLRHPLALQRSLRPLKRRIDAPVRLELDEQATADRIARLGAAPEWWLPVMRPAQERWLRLNLVYDDGPTMPVWRPLIHELHTALAQSGIFRTVALHRAAPDGTIRHHAAHTPADGRTVTLLFSDCMGPQWREGPAGSRWYGMLRRWARRMPLAVVQPLPEHLWPDTALPTAPGRLSAPHPAAPTAALTFTPYDTTVRHEGDGAIALPVLEPGPEWLANWAALIATPGGTEHSASAALLTGPLPADADDRTDVARLSAEDLVLRFRATSSPEAFRLAGHLALGRPDLPVMRLVQAALEPRPRPQHLAEVILSGMLTTVPGPPGSYAFRPGVRDLLLRGLPRTARGRTAELLARVGGLIDERAGAAPGEFLATAPAAGGTPTPVDDEAFATVSPESVRQLSGEGGSQFSAPGRLGRRYRVVRRLGPSRSLWEAQDTEANRTVVLRLHEPVTDPARRDAFLRDARLLRDLNQRNVVTVHDFGMEDDVPYVVMEHLDGLALNSLAEPSGYRLPTPVTVSLAWQLAQALGALHQAGFAHIGLDMTKVLLLPDGTAKLTLLPLERTTEQDEYSADLRTLGQLLFHLASGHPRGDGTPVSPDRLTGLPVQLRAHFASALDALLADELDDQRGGLSLLQNPTLLSPLATVHARLRYALLGPPAVDRGEGRPLALGSPQEQAMLCMLLLHHGRKVTRAELTEGIWERKPPARADALLGTYASRLRNALGPGVLATLSDGYAVHTSADIVDVIHCQQLVAEADRERTAGRVELAHRWVNEALGLWHGDTALDGVPGPAAAAARTRLLRLRLGLFRTRAELDLELGEFERAADSLGGLIRAYPSREDFRRLHLIALKGQGRIAEALEVYEEYRLSGGTNPELLLLGRELREEFGETPEDPPEPGYEMGEDVGTAFGVTAPDETQDGSFPEGLPSLLYPSEEFTDEIPLPQDYMPDSLFAAEDVPSASTGRSRPVGDRVLASYLWADGPHDPDAVPALGRAVTRLIAAAGLEEPAYELLRQPAGYTVVMESDDSARSLLWTTMGQFEDFLVLLGGFRLLITYSCGGEGGAEEPDAALLRHTLDDTEARGILGVPTSLRDELGENQDQAPWLEPLGPDPAAGWYRPGLLAHMLHESTRFLPSALGPHPLTATQPLPEPHGLTKNVVFALPGGAFSLTRTRAAHSYYEVDLTTRHAAHEVLLPSFAGGTFIASVELSWHVDDPVAHVRGGPANVPERLLDHLTEEARRITRRHPLTRAGAAQNALRDALRHWPVPGLSVACSVRLTAHREEPGAPPHRT